MAFLVSQWACASCGGAYPEKAEAEACERFHVLSRSLGLSDAPRVDRATPSPEARAALEDIEFEFGAILQKRARDSDRSGEAVETTGSTEGESAGPTAIAQPSSVATALKGERA